MKYLRRWIMIGGLPLGHHAITPHLASQLLILKFEDPLRVDFERNALEEKSDEERVACDPKVLFPWPQCKPDFVPPLRCSNFPVSIQTGMMRMETISMPGYIYVRIRELM
jgi:hypothetical protein